MKRTFTGLLVLIIIFKFTTCCNAEEFTVSSSDEIPTFETEDYLPNEVTDILDKNGLNEYDELSIENVFSFIFKLLEEVITNYSAEICLILGIVLVSAIIPIIIDNGKYKTIILYIIQITIISVIVSIYIDLTLLVSNTITSLSEILKAVVPAFSGVLLLGGSTFSAAASSASFGTVLLLLDEVLKNILLPMTDVMVMFLMLERLSPQFSGLGVVKVLKKYILSILSFITTMFLTVLSYQGIIGSAKDSASARTVKFAASSFIPVIGGAVGESFRTLSAGLKLLKTSVGYAVSLSVFVTVLPAFLSIFVLKLQLHLLAFVSGLTCSQETKTLFESSVSLLDILNAIIICITILSLLIIILFSLSATAVSV